MSPSPNDPIAATRAGTVIFLIDESRGMAAPVAGGAGTKAETVATAVNSMLNQLASGPPVQVAVVGYRASGERGEASPRWAGPLAGRELVKSEELAAATLSVEERVRRIPGARGHDPAREETIRFPIWYVPAPGGTAAFDAAAACCRRLLQLDAAAERPARPPLILHVGSELPPAEVLGGEAYQAVAAGALWCHLQLGATTRIPPTLYPSTDAHLPSAPLRELFSASCVLPEALAAARAAQVPVPPGGRGLVYQAAIGDLIRFVSLAKAYAAAPDAAFAPAGSAAVGPPGESPGCAGGVFDTQLPARAGDPAAGPLAVRPGWFGLVAPAAAGQRPGRQPCAAPAAIRTWPSSRTAATGSRSGSTARWPGEKPSPMPNWPAGLRWEERGEALQRDRRARGAGAARGRYSSTAARARPPISRRGARGNQPTRRNPLQEHGQVRFADRASPDRRRLPARVRSTRIRPTAAVPLDHPRHSSAARLPIRQTPVGSTTRGRSPYGGLPARWSAPSSSPSAAAAPSPPVLAGWSSVRSLTCLSIASTRFCYVNSLHLVPKLRPPPGSQAPASTRFPSSGLGTLPRDRRFHHSR